MAQPSKIDYFFRKYSFIWIGLLIGMVVISAVFPPLLVANVAFIGLALAVQAAIIVGSILAGGAIGGFIGQLAHMWKMNFSKESLLAKWNHTWNFDSCLNEVLPRMEVKDSTEKDYFVEIVRKMDVFVTQDSVRHRRLIGKSNPAEMLAYQQQVDDFIEKTNIYLKELLEKQIEPHLKTDDLRRYRTEKESMRKPLMTLIHTLQNYSEQLTMKKKDVNPGGVLEKFQDVLTKLEDDPPSQAVPEKDASQDAPKQEENSFSPLFLPLPQNLSPAQKEIQDEIQALRIKGNEIEEQIQNKRFENQIEDASDLFHQELKSLIQDYKKIALLCHPDKWSQASTSEKEGAESLFKELTSVIEQMKKNWVVALQGHQSDENISAENKEHYAHLDQLDKRIYKIRKEREEILAAFRAEILEIRRTCLPHTLPKEITCRELIIYQDDSNKNTKKP